MTESRTQFTGNLTNDPELRFTNSGHPVANFTVAVTPRTKNAAGEWVDAETNFHRCSAWRDLGENVAASLARGHRVNVTGVLRSRTYETQSGEKRTAMEVVVDTVGPDLRFATVKVTKASRSGAGAAPTPEEDPWTGEGATLTPEEYQARMQQLRDNLGAQPVPNEPPF
jgi:single-strand DNA-binding protein